MSNKIILIIGAFICYLLADGCTFSIGILYTEFLNVFHQSKVMTSVLPGLIYSIPQLSGIIICPLVNTIGSDYGALFGGVVLSASFFVSRFVVSFHLMYITLGLFASLGLELTYVSGIMAVTKGFKEGKYLGLALGIAVSGSGIGVFIFNPLINFLIEEFGWQGTMIIESAIFMNIVVAGCLFRLSMCIYGLPKDRMSLKKKSKLRIEVVTNQNNYHSMARKISQSNSAEALDTLKDGYRINTNISPGQNSKSNFDNNQRPSTFLSKTQTKRCEPFYKPINAQNKSWSLDRRVSTGDSFPVQLPVDERAASFVRRLSLYSSQNIKGSSQNIKTSHETISTQPSLTHENTEEASPINGSNIESAFDLHLISAQEAQPSSRFNFFINDLKKSVVLLSSVKIWTNRSLLLFYFASFLFAMSVVVVWTFSYNNSINLNIIKSKASLLVSFIGVGSCFGQIFFGYISDFFPAISLYAFGCVCSGLITLILRYITSYWLLALLHAFFGFSQGVSYALFSVILVHYTSVDLYHASLAVFLLISGSGNLIGTSLAGYMNDLTGDYAVAYTSAGFILLMSGVSVFPLIFALHRSNGRM